MNKNIRKILSIIIIFTVICSILTISYAAVSENYSRILNNDGFNKLEKLGKTDNSNLQTKSATLQLSANDDEQQSMQVSAENAGIIPESENAESYQIPSKPLILKNNGIMKAMSTENVDKTVAVDYTADEITAHRQEKLEKLQEKYPTEYQYIISKTEIDPYFYVSLLERIDLWEISDLEEYIDEYIVNGFDGLEQYHTTLKTVENNTLEEGDDNE